MLKYNGVTLFVNATASFCDIAPEKKDIADKSFRNFNVLEVNSLKNELYSIPSKRKSKSNYYPLLFVVNDAMVPALLLPDGSRIRVEVTIELFESGFVIFQIGFKITEIIEVRNVNCIINDLINESRLSLGNAYYNYEEYAKYVLKIIKGELLPQKGNPIVFSEAYSIIRPDSFDREIDSQSIIDSDYELDLYEAAIRRIPDMKEAPIDFARKEQKNLSVSVNDLVFLNYHNLLVYVVEGKNHLKADLYIEIVNQFKLYIAILSSIQDEVNLNLAKLREVPTKLKDLSNESDRLDSNRFDFLKAREELEIAISVSSSRVAWFNNAVYAKFRIFEIQDRLEEDLDKVEQVIQRKLTLLRERHLQRISTLLAILSLVLGIIDVLVAIFLTR